jgi:hypothetical protein
MTNPISDSLFDVFYFSGFLEIFWSFHDALLNPKSAEKARAI